MDEKSLNIVAPEGYEIDKEKSTFEKIVFKKKTIRAKFYTDVARQLFYNKTITYINEDGKTDDFICNNAECISYPNNCTSKKQAGKLVAINKLMNVAKYLNGDWKPDWFDGESKFHIRFDHISNVISIGSESIISSGVIFF